MIWRTIANYLSPGRRRGAHARLELTESYRVALSGDAGKVVVADLANFTGFFEVTAAHAPPEIRAFNDGKRAAFWRLFHFLNLSDEERASLMAAVRLETSTDAAEGYLEP